MGAAASAVIVNADDYGLSDAVTADIAACIAAGRVTSTTVMANLPGLEAACQLARESRFDDRIGVHLNLTYGPPLSEAIRPWCDATGQLALAERRLVADGRLLAAVYAELRAQVERVIAHGIRPTHLDSHHHIINGFPYSRVAVRVAKELGIPRIRITRNAFYQRSLTKTPFKWSYNRYLRWAGMRTVDYFTDIKPYLAHLQEGGAPLSGAVELMCHPGAQLQPAVNGHADETALLLSDEVGAALGRMRLVSYTAI